MKISDFNTTAVNVGEDQSRLEDCICSPQSFPAVRSAVGISCLLAVFQ